MKNWHKVIAWLCVTGYVFVILYKTVLSRTAAEEYKYNFHLFWSYLAIWDGTRPYLIKEHFLNVALFIPLGVFLWFALKYKLWWKAFFFGCSVSLSIEILQLILKKGLCELDDVFHNTLGCLIGIGACRLGSMIIINAKKRIVR